MVWKDKDRYTTEWYDFIDDKSLQTIESYHCMILVCEGCGAIFSMKACGMRTLFPWFGYHPTDGNAKVLTGKCSRIIRDMAYKCDCNSPMPRITKKSILDSSLKEVINYV